MRQHLKRDTRIVFDHRNRRIVHHRPFVKQWLYYEPLCINEVYRIPAIFPEQRTTGGAIAASEDGHYQVDDFEPYPVLPNQAIHVMGPGATRGFSALITDTTPDLELVSKGQTFPRYRYETAPATAPGRLDLADPTTGSQDKPGSDGRVDNITGWCLTRFRQHYNDPSITKDGIWAYIYGVLHAPDWRTRYAHDLRKGLPRVPFAADFGAFRDAGQALIDLHLGYETCEPWPLTVTTPAGPDDAGFYRIDGRMRWDRTRNSDGKLVDNRSVLHVNGRCRIKGIPDEAQPVQGQR